MIFIVLAIVGCNSNSTVSKKSKINYAMENPKNTIVATLTAAQKITSTSTPAPTQQFPKYKLKINEDIQKYLYNKCKENNWEYELILSLIKQESDFNIEGINYNNNGTVDIGLVQINSSNVEWLKKATGNKNFSPYNPYNSIDACLINLNSIKNFWVNEDIKDENILLLHCLNSYNMGIQGFKNYKINTSSISREYDKKIKKYYEKLKEKGGFNE
jgi:hypothetical protein